MEVKSRTRNSVKSTTGTTGYYVCCLVRGRGGVAELHPMYPRGSQGNVKCCPCIPHTEWANTHIYEHGSRLAYYWPRIYAESYRIHARSVCQGPGLWRGWRIARTCVPYFANKQGKIEGFTRMQWMCKVPSRKRRGRGLRVFTNHALAPASAVASQYNCGKMC